MKIRQSPFCGALAPPSCLKAEGTHAADSRPQRTTGIEKRDDVGSRDYQMRWRKTGRLEWVKAKSSGLVAHPFPVL